MSYQVLARKYRPQRFSEVIGQDHVTQTLKNAIEQERIAHGYIFSGHRGIGKTTIARILAMALNCRSSERPVSEPCGKCDSCVEIREGRGFDVIEIDAATNRGIDEVRRIRDEARVQPARDRYKVFILDEAHQITDAAFNAILKTLEEPPDWAVFMMATTQPEDIPQTIRSRCQHFSFHAVKFDDIVGQLRTIADQEGIPADDDAIALLAEAGDGSMRDALSIMDQAIACCTGRLTIDVVRGLVGAVSSDTLEQLMNAVQRNSSEDALRLIDRLVTEGHSPAHFARQMVRFLRNATVAKIAGRDSSLLQISSDERARVARVAEMFSEEDLARFLQIILRTHGDVSYKQEQRFHLELGILKLVHATRLLPLEQILSGAEVSGAKSPQGTGGPARAATAPARGSATAHARSASQPSPFESDSSRKTPRASADAPYSSSSASTPTSRAGEVSARPFTVTSTVGGGAAAAPAVATEEPLPEHVATSPADPAGDVEPIRERVLSALESAGQMSLPSTLGEGEWQLSGDVLTITVNSSPTVVDLMMTHDAQRLLNQSASAATGRNVKVKVTGGATTVARPAQPRTSGNGTSARSRAAQDPIVQKMLQTFTGDIRTVIDQKKG